MFYFICHVSIIVRHPFLRNSKGTYLAEVKFGRNSLTRALKSAQKGYVGSGSITVFGIKNKKKKFRNQRP
jgi:hypothetical protein